MKHPLLITFLFLSAISVAARAETELVSNGEFGQVAEIRGWDSLKFLKNSDGDNGFKPAPEMLLWEKDDGADNQAGSLRLRIEKTTDFTYKCNQSGARCLLKPTTDSANMDLMVRFSAKTVSGSPFLYISRFAGGGGVKKPIELGKDWAEYEVRLPINFPTALIVFNLVASEDALQSLEDHTPTTPDLADGECLIDNVSIVAVPKE